MNKAQYNWNNLLKCGSMRAATMSIEINGVKLTVSSSIPNSHKEAEEINKAIGMLSTGWQTCNPPKDGTVIVARGQITQSDETGGRSFSFTDSIRFSDGLWVYENGMSVAEYSDETVRIFAWILPHGKEVA